jgi:hypothetical protein
VIRVLLAAGVVAALMIAGPMAWRSIHIAYWLHRCGYYAMPAGTVAFETDPLKVRGLLASTPQYRPTEMGDPNPGRPVASWQPNELVALGNLIDTPNAKLGVPFWEFPPIVFLGELKSPSGISRLVVIRFDAYTTFNGPPYAAYVFTTTIIHPGWAWIIPQHPTYDLQIPDDGRIIQHGQDPNIHRLFFGTHNPADAARFEVGYQTDTGSGSFTVRLSDDGEKLLLGDK